MIKKSVDKIGEILVRDKILSLEDLDKALHIQARRGGLLGNILLRLGFISENELLVSIARQLGMEAVRLNTIAIPRSVLDRIPARFALYNHVLPIDDRDGLLSIAMANPLEQSIHEDLAVFGEGHIKIVLALEQELNEAIRRHYEPILQEESGKTRDNRLKRRDEDKNPSTPRPAQETTLDSDEQSVVQIVDRVIREAYRQKATDVHWEPDDDSFIIRYRVDGMLIPVRTRSDIKNFQQSITARIKILSNLNIAETRLPQDGRFSMDLGGRMVDLRVSTFPTPDGESIVLRILSPEGLKDFGDLGLSERHVTTLNRSIHKPYGIILVTGPTGSGKSTTLYTALNHINSNELKIITLEDPIEYRISGVVQSQVNPKIGLTFAQGLRSMLRHDPDVMMVGEIRDGETAEIAVQLSLTGHLVFSTLHTNDAPSSIARLVNMGIEPFLIGASVKCIVAQRLVRTICPNCREERAMPETMPRLFGVPLNLAHPFTYFVGAGCSQCRGKGYLGRTAVYEILEISSEIQRLILEKASERTIREAGFKEGMTSLRQDGWEKILKGITTPEEVLRVTTEE